MADDRRRDDDRTRVIRTGPSGSGRAPDAPPGSGVLPPGARRPGSERPGSRSPYGPDDDPRAPRTGDPRRGDPRTGDPRRGGPGDGRGPAGAPAGPPSGPGPRRRRRFPVKTVILLVVLAIIAYPIALGLVAWKHLGRVDALPTDTASTPGRTYLVVGSDSRKGLTKQQAKQLHTGHADVGQRTDTIMLLHVPAGGGPTVLMSVPRDSYVAIPGHGHNKVNAAFAFGGPKLLARTLEQATGVQIDDYVEIGFGGFASMVDAVGGVQICPKFAMNDRDAGIKLKKGCQQADGPTALGYARARHSDPRGDLGRVERQREVLAAIVSKATTVGTVVNPFKTFPLASSGASTLTVDEHTGPLALLRFVLGMKATAGGKGLSLTVPVSGTGTRPGAGSVVLWDDAKAQQVFTALKRSETESIRPIAEQQHKLASR